MPISLAVNDTGFVRLLAGYKERFVKKPIIAIVIVIVLGASLAWFKRVDVMLAVVIGWIGEAWFRLASR